MTALASLRREYALSTLDETQLDPDPMSQFTTWFQHACHAELPEPNAMTLATVNPAGQPSARIVLLKNVDAQGFVFFSNYDSRKGQDLAYNPRASLLFYWEALERQVRIEGSVVTTSAAQSDAYFNARPLASRIGAWASMQSAIIADRATLEARSAQFATTFGSQPPRPPQWGGYRLTPDAIEFWQGRPSRLHDRLQYLRHTSGAWHIVRLAP